MAQERCISTFHERDRATALDYRNARYSMYDIPRFNQIDLAMDEYPSFSPYSYVAGNPVILVDPDGRNYDGYRNTESGELVWDFEHKEESFESEGVKYERVSDDYFEFSDMALEQQVRIRYQGILDVGTAEYDDVIAAFAYISKELAAGWTVRANRIFDFSNVNEENGWKLHARGFAGGGSKNFTLDEGSARVYINIEMSKSMSYTNLPFLYSPVTNSKVKKNKDGKYYFKPHKYEYRIFGLMLLGTRTTVNHNSNSDEVGSLIRYSSGKSLMKTWKYLIREYKD